MNAQEAQRLHLRITEYHGLEALLKQTRTAIDQITLSRPDDPNQTGPFTGNTRESRLITQLDISFSQTRGGSPPVSMTIQDLRISASDFKEALLVMLNKRKSDLKKQMDAL